MEHEARFQRIEGTLETLAKAQLHAEQAHSDLSKAQLRTQHALTDAVELMTRNQKQLFTSQVLMFDELGKVAAAQVKTQAQVEKTQAQVEKTEAQMEKLAIKSAETQDKLDALIHMWDEMIRERGKNGHPPPPAS